MIHSTNKSAQYRPDIDGLRSLAIIPVVLFHAGVPFLRGGFVGVDVFFVISGFLIGALVFREMEEGRFSLKRFYERRTKRILPALLVLLTFCFVPACMLLSGTELKGVAAETLATLTSVSNIYFGRSSDYFASAAEFHPLLMTWSLGVEEQFYFFFPLIMFLIVRYTRRRLLLVLAAFCALSFFTAVYALSLYPTQTFYLLPSRAWELGLGTMLGIHEAAHPPEAGDGNRLARELMGFGGLALLLYGVFAFSGSTAFPGFAALAPTLAAVTLLRGRGSWVNTHVLASRPLVAIGLLSYSWYLWHWPLMSFARIAMAGSLPLRVGLTLAVVSLGSACASYFFVERPFRRPSPLGSAVLPKYAFASLALCAPALLLLLTHGWPGRYPAAQKVDAANDASLEDPCLVRYRDSQLKTDVLCRSGDPARPALAIMGDSHAAALAPALRSAAVPHAWRVDDFTKASCPQLDTVTTYIPSRRHHDRECAAFSQAALRRVLSDPGVRTVVLAGYWAALFPREDNGVRFIAAGERAADVTQAASWKNFESGLLQVTQTLRHGGKQVVLVVDVPRFTVDPVLAARTNAIPVRAKLNHFLGGFDLGSGEQPETVAVDAVDRRVAEVLRHIASETGATVLDLRERLCEGSSCRFGMGGLPLYVDSQHLSSSGADYALHGATLFR